MDVRFVDSVLQALGGEETCRRMCASGCHLSRPPDVSVAGMEQHTRVGEETYKRALVRGWTSEKPQSFYLLGALHGLAQGIELVQQHCFYDNFGLTRQEAKDIAKVLEIRRKVENADMSEVPRDLHVSLGTVWSKKLYLALRAGLWRANRFGEEGSRIDDNTFECLLFFFY